MMSRFCIFFWLISPEAVAQKSLKFSELLTYSYTKNEKSAETSVYLDRKTSTWLFTNDDTFGGTAEGLAFVVAYPSGTYLLCGTDDTGTNVCQRYHTKPVSGRPSKISGKGTGKRTVFGKNKYGWPTLTGVQYVPESPSSFRLKTGGSSHVSAAHFSAIELRRCSATQPVSRVGANAGWGKTGLRITYRVFRRLAYLPHCRRQPLNALLLCISCLSFFLS